MVIFSHFIAQIDKYEQCFVLLDIIIGARREMGTGKGIKTTITFFILFMLFFYCDKLRRLGLELKIKNMQFPNVTS